MKILFQSNSFAYFEIILHPGLQMKESSWKSETGMILHCLFPNHLVLQASSGLQHSEFWAQIKEKEASCLPMPVPAGRADCSGVSVTPIHGLDWWEGRKRTDRSNHTAFTSAFLPLIHSLKASKVLHWKASTVHSLAKVSGARLFVLKYANLSYSVRISAKFLLLPRFQHFFIS